MLILQVLPAEDIFFQVQAVSVRDIIRKSKEQVLQEDHDHVPDILRLCFG